MFMHNKRLMYTVRVSEPNPKLASLLLEQFGGPDGELAAAMRYFTQALGEEDAGRRDMLFDIATEEMSHLEVIGNVIAMLNRGVKASMAEGAEVGELMSEVFRGGESHTTSVLYGGGTPLVNSAGVPWTAAYVDTRTEPTVDLRSNIAAEARAKIIYERLINVVDDPDIRDTLGFLMTREIAHQKSFEKALYSIEQNFPPGKIAGKPEFTDKYFDMSKGEDMRGPWNQGDEWDFVADPLEQQSNGAASVNMAPDQLRLMESMMMRSKSRTDINPTTGADLGAGPGAGSTKLGSDANRSDVGAGSRPTSPSTRH